jgi:hypothetical protein
MWYAKTERTGPVNVRETRFYINDNFRRTFWISSFEPITAAEIYQWSGPMWTDGWAYETYITLSLGRAALMAEITSVRHERTFSVIPSLSIMIICRVDVYHPTLPLGNIDIHKRLPGGRCLGDQLAILDL